MLENYILFPGDEYYPLRRNNRLLGDTPLILAAVDGTCEEVDYILAKYTDHESYINLQDTSDIDGYHNTALILAAMKGRTTIVKKLIAAGANVNIANNHGTTALHYACIFRDHEQIQALLQQGAKWAIENSQGISPLDLYLYPFDEFHHDLNARAGDDVRELETLLEHSTFNLNQRPEIKPELFNITDPASYTCSSIRKLTDKKITYLVQQIPYQFILNNPEQYDRYCGLKKIYINYNEFKKAWDDLAAKEPNAAAIVKQFKIKLANKLSNVYGTGSNSFNDNPTNIFQINFDILQKYINENPSTNPLVESLHKGIHLFKHDLTLWVNNSKIGVEEHRIALEFGVKACGIVNNLIAKPLTPERLSFVLQRFEKLKQKIPVAPQTSVANICLGILNIVLTFLWLVAETITIIPHLITGRDLYTKTDAQMFKAETFFKSPASRTVERITDLCNLTQQIIDDEQLISNLYSNGLH